MSPQISDVSKQSDHNQT